MPADNDLEPHDETQIVSNVIGQFEILKTLGDFDSNTLTSFEFFRASMVGSMSMYVNLVVNLGVPHALKFYRFFL